MGGGVESRKSVGGLAWYTKVTKVGYRSGMVISAFAACGREVKEVT
jgi:hypothetical protein